MEIVHELNQLEFGGVEKIVRNLIKFDGKNKHKIIAYKDGPFRSEFEKVNAEIIFSEEDKEKEFSADIIHIHSGGAISNIAVELGEQVPIIETIHSPIRSPMPNKFIRQRVGVTEAVCRMNDNCISVYNGIDFSEMEPTKTPEETKRELGIPEGIPVIGRLGRIGKDKCLEEWLLTCYYLQQEGLEFIPLIVGGEAMGLCGYVGKLKLMAKSLPVRNVIWAGHRNDIVNYLQVMDVFLYPSPTEGFGMVFAEAMYSGAVVVTYKNEVTMEVAGGYSLLTDDSIGGLVKGVKKALDIGIRDAIIPIAREFVSEEFDAERMAKDYQAIYEVILK